MQDAKKELEQMIKLVEKYKTDLEKLNYIDSTRGKEFDWLNDKIKETQDNMSKLDVNDIDGIKSLAVTINEIESSSKDVRDILREVGRLILSGGGISDGLNGVVSKVKNFQGGKTNSSNQYTATDSTYLKVRQDSPKIDDSVDGLRTRGNLIEYEKGLLSRFGKTRKEAELDFGFKVTEQDVKMPIQEQEDKVKTAQTSIKQLEKKKESGLIDESDFIEQIKPFNNIIDNSINEIERIQSYLGKRIDGYIDLAHRATEVIKDSKATLLLYDEIKNDLKFNFGDYSDLIKQDPKTFNGEIQDMSEYEKGLTAEQEEQSRKNAEALRQKVKADEEALRLEKEELEKEKKKVVANKDILIKETDDVIKNNGVFTNSKELSTNRGKVDSTLAQVKYFSSLELEDKEDIELDVSTSGGMAKLDAFKDELESAVRVADELKARAEQIKESSTGDNKFNIFGESGVMNESHFEQVRNLLSSGYGVNLKGKDLEKFNKVKDTYNETLGILNESKESLSSLNDEDVKQLTLKSKEVALQKQLELQEKKIAEEKANGEKDLNRLYEERLVKSKQVDLLTENKDIKKQFANGYDAREKIEKEYNEVKTDNKGAVTYRAPLAEARFELAKIDTLIKQKEEQLKAYEVEFNINVDGIDIDDKLDKATVERNKDLTDKRDKANAKELLDEITTHVKTQEILNNEKMSYGSQVAYYTKMLPLFASNTREYIEVLRLKQDAERNLSKEIEFNRNQEFNKIKQYPDTYKKQTGREMSSSQKASYFKNAASEYMLKNSEVDGAFEKYEELLKEATRWEDKAVEETKQNTQQIINTVQDMCGKISNAINRIIGIIRTALSLVAKGVRGTVAVISGVFNGIKRLIQIFGSLSNRVRGTDGAFNSFKNSATELRSKLLLLKGAIDQLFNNEFIKKAEVLYQSVYSLKNIVGTEATTATIGWANEMERAFGISAKQLLSDLNEITGVLYGMGMSAKDTAVASQNVLMISRYLAFMGAAGGDVDIVVGKILSGMKGMTQAIDDLGLSVRYAQMDDFLGKLKKSGGEFANIEENAVNLSEQARVYVRYASLIEQFTSKYDLSEFQNSLNTTTGRITLMKQSIQSMVTTVGQVLLKIASAVSEYVIVITKLIEGLAKKIASLVGSLTGLDMNIDVWHGMNDGGEDVIRDIDSLNGGLVDVEENAKKAKGALGGFDRIESISSSDKDNKGDEFDYSKLMTSALDALNKKAAQVSEDYIDRLYKNFINKFDGMINKVEKFGEKLTGITGFTFNFDLQQFRKDFAELSQNIGNVIKRVTTGITKYALIISHEFQIGKVFNGFISVFSSFFNMLDKGLKASSDGFRVFYNLVISPMVQMISGVLIDNMERLKKLFDKWADWFENNGDSVTKFWVDLGYLISDTREDVFNGLAGAFDKLLVIIKELWKILEPLIQEFGNFLKNEFLPWFLEQLDRFGQWLAENSNEIRELIKSVSNIAWNSFKVFVEIVAKLVDIVVKHPKAIVGFFGALMALKVGAWFVSTGIGIAKAVNELKAFSDLVKASTIPAKMNKIGNSIKKAFLKGVSNYAVPVGSALDKGVAMATSTAGLGLIGGGMAVADGLGGLKKSEEWIGDKGKTTSGKVSSFVGGAIGGKGGGILDEEASATKKASEVGLNALKGAALGGSIGSVIPGVGTAIGAAVGGVVGTITGAIGGENISKAINSSWEFVKTTSSNAWNGIKTASVNAWQGISEVSSQMCSSIAEFSSGLWNNIKQVSSNCWNNVKAISLNVASSVRNIWGGVRTSLSSVFSSVASAGSRAWNSIKSTATSVINNIVSAFTSIPQKISSAFNSVGNMISSTWNKVTSFGGSKINVSAQGTPQKSKGFKIPKITMRASGGSVKSGGLFVANENGQPELVGNFGKGGTSVANNDMIINAMKSAVYESTYNALAETLGQMNTQGKGETHIHIGESGLNVFDESTLRELGRRISPVLLGNNVNIANTSFSL